MLQCGHCLSASVYTRIPAASRCRGPAADAQCRSMVGDTGPGAGTPFSDWVAARLHQHTGSTPQDHAGGFDAFLGQVSRLHY